MTYEPILTRRYLRQRDVRSERETVRNAFNNARREVILVDCRGAAH